MPPGPAWREAVENLWASGAAFLPVDDRLAEPEVVELLGRARPEMLFDGEDVTELAGGLPVDPSVRLVVATSGTGGAGRLVALTREAIDHAVSGSTLALEARQDEPWVCCLPLAHIGGLLVLLRGVLTDAPVSIHPRFDPSLVARERGAAFISLVPTMLARLLAASVDLSGYRAVLLGGAPLDPALAERAASAGVPVVETYGLTETCGGVVYGGRPLAGTEFRIGSGSEIQLRGPTVMAGYHLDPEATEEAFTEDGWLRSGDAGRADTDGRLRIDGRMDECIVTGGEKVWPEEVEAALREHPKVSEVVVAGRPDPEWGERVVAFVVPRRPEKPPTLEGLRRYAAKRIARFKAPRELVLLDELPGATVLGKVRRGDLR